MIMSNSDLDIVEYIIIGAGVIGLAIARQIALSGRDILIIEGAKTIGSGISARNSEVIHAGIYYPKDSLKAKFCVRGKELLYQYAKNHNIEHNNCGKILVATNDAQTDRLEGIKTQAANNGVLDLELITSSAAKSLENSLSCKAALFSPSTGIIDAHAFMLSLLGEVEDNGGSCSFLSKVERITPSDSGFTLNINCQGEDITIRAKNVINAAGLSAVKIAENIASFPKDKCPEQRYAKGNYFKLTGKHDFKHLIYPLPQEAGLGIHLTLDLAGQVRFGPDVEWVDRPDYNVNTARKDDFYKAIRSYIPTLPDNSLIPDYCGIRPKIFFDDKPYTDFLIQDEKDHGIARLINLFGIESPGLTASLAIAEYIDEMIYIS